MKILWFGHPDFEGNDFSITSLPFNPRDFLSGMINSHRVINLGRNGVVKSRMIGTSFGVDELFRERDRDYIELCEKVVTIANSYDVLVMSQFNFIHPHFLKKIKALKVFGMVDDPISTFDRGLVYSHFFDCSFHISQGYWDGVEMADLMNDFGLRRPFHFPLTSLALPTDLLSKHAVSERTRSVVYIGAAYGKKVDTLLKFKRALKDDFAIFGRWPFKGYYGLARILWGAKLFPYRVRKIDESDKWVVMLDTKIGLNIHYTGLGNEDGNMRTYEILSTGGLLLQNNSAVPADKRLFKDGVDAIYYRSYNDAIDKVGYFLKNDAERTEIALNGHKKFMENFTHSKNLSRFVLWLKEQREEWR